ncbi:MSHA biogenesis protein MshI [Shewanella sp. JBTF-M18]|uniref:MSHA biogenesis protein MshI n=1 Tax=Shewanella insulae TaxID=2681496 RepID=A0A6L7HYC4_9GAMM|nr:MSHA biogenesis protein MshI [Shewanella insulae]MXR69296.1 MSHA biogenesis protein MshI [Shewanella insulae]
MENSLLSKFAFWQTKHDRVDLGVYLNAAAVTFFKRDSGTSFSLPLSGDDWSGVFEALTDKIPAPHLQLVLSEDFYQLMVVDKPMVEPEEMHQALIWSIKDMVSESVESLHLDYFELPESTNNKVTVVAVNRAMLQALVKAADKHDVTIAGISIEEMAISNYGAEDKLAHMVLCHKPGSELLLTVVKQGQLYMQRRIRGFSQIDRVSSQDLKLNVADNLSLELQRSMDYFESQLRQAPVASIALLMGGECQMLAQLLSKNFDQAVEVIACDQVQDKLAQWALAELERQTEEPA